MLKTILSESYDEKFYLLVFSYECLTIEDRVFHLPMLEKSFSRDNDENKKKLYFIEETFPLKQKPGKTGTKRYYYSKEDALKKEIAGEKHVDILNNSDLTIWQRKIKCLSSSEVLEQYNRNSTKTVAKTIQIFGLKNGRGEIEEFFDPYTVMTQLRKFASIDARIEFGSDVYQLVQLFMRFYSMTIKSCEENVSVHNLHIEPHLTRFSLNEELSGMKRTQFTLLSAKYLGAFVSFIRTISFQERTKTKNIFIHDRRKTYTSDVWPKSIVGRNYLNFWSQKLRALKVFYSTLQGQENSILKAVVQKFKFPWTRRHVNKSMSEQSANISHTVVGALDPSKDRYNIDQIKKPLLRVSRGILCEELTKIISSWGSNNILDLHEISADDFTENSSLFFRVRNRHSTFDKNLNKNHGFRASMLSVQAGEQISTIYSAFADLQNEFIKTLCEKHSISIDDAIPIDIKTKRVFFSSINTPLSPLLGALCAQKTLAHAFTHEQRESMIDEFTKQSIILVPMYVCDNVKLIDPIEFASLFILNKNIPFGDMLRLRHAEAFQLLNDFVDLVEALGHDQVKYFVSESADRQLFIEAKFLSLFATHILFCLGLVNSNITAEDELKILLRFYATHCEGSLETVCDMIKNDYVRCSKLCGIIKNRKPLYICHIQNVFREWGRREPFIDQMLKATDTTNFNFCGKSLLKGEIAKYVSNITIKISKKLCDDNDINNSLL